MSGALAPLGSQSFATSPVQQVPLALYTLSIRSPGSLSSALALYSYTFPLTPQAVRKEVPTPNAIFDTQGSPTTGGIARTGDEYGQALPIFTIRGTTGYAYHSADGYQWTGLQSCQRLEALLRQYATLNQGQIKAQQTDLYSLEFYDYFKSEFWQVLPLGVQTVEQSADRPMLPFYTFRLAALAQVQDPLPADNDAVSTLLSQDSGSGTAQFQSYSLQMGDFY